MVLIETDAETVLDPDAIPTYPSRIYCGACGQSNDHWPGCDENAFGETAPPPRICRKNVERAAA